MSVLVYTMVLWVFEIVGLWLVVIIRYILINLVVYLGNLKYINILFRCYEYYIECCFDKKFIKLFYVRENLLLEYWLLGICKLLDGKLYKVMIMCEKGGKFDNIYSRIVFKYIIGLSLYFI